MCVSRGSLVAVWDVGKRRRGRWLERSGRPTKDLRAELAGGGKDVNGHPGEGRLSQKSREECVMVFRRCGFERL